MNERERKEIEVFNAALELTSPAERAAYLKQACGDEPALRQKVEALLRVHAEADEFFDKATENAGARLSPAVAAARGPSGTVTLTPLTEGPGTVIGRYKLLQQIGEGGFGAVYMAEQKEPVKRRVALKIIKLGMDTRQVVARFEAERQALALMDHPNIAKVFDAGATESGRPYFVMELVRGVPITQYCDENNLPPIERLRLFTQVCHAIQHAHQKGIIHRDIKPSNILVTLHDGVPVPKVIDFGIAKATQQELTEKTVFTQFQQFIGTPAYMSPEQAELSGLDIDTRSDIYALGVLLYELLTGKTPFDAKELLSAGLDEMRRTIREREPVRPSMRVSTMADAERTSAAKHRQSEVPKLIHLLRGDLDWIVMKCLEKDRTHRYETANGLAQDLERHLSHQPVVARPASAAYRVQKFVRRNKVMVMATGLVAAALVLGIVVSTWQAVRASRLRVRAEANEQKAVAAQVKEVAERQKAERAQASEAEQRRLAVQAGEVAQRNLYMANMNLAKQAWEQNNVGRLRELLEETQASPDRGFEWYYWQRQTHLALKTLRGHLEGVSSVAFSLDGQRILTGSWDQTAKVWEAATGRELLTLKGHRAGVYSVAFSADGQRIVTGSDDHTAKVWEAATGQELLTLKGHSAPIDSVGVSPDGQRIVTGSVDQTAKVWEAGSGKELLTLQGHTNTIHSVAFSPDGQRIVTGSWDQTAKVWEAATGRELLTLKGHSGLVASVAFSPDGQRIVTGSWDQTAKVWEAASGRELLTLRDHTNWIGSVASSPDGQRIVTGSWDQTAKVWEAARAEQIAAWQAEERAAEQSLAALQRERTAEQERQRIARAGDEGAIKRWLVLAPIPLATGQSGAEGLDAEQIAGEARLRPVAGEAKSIGNGELNWQEVAQEDYVIDFNAIVGQETPFSVTYAVCYIRSEAEQRGLRMLVGSGDEAKVYLNEKQIHKYPGVHWFFADEDTVRDITLKKGLNVLVFKVVNETAAWQGSIRFTDAAGQPLKGIRVTLDPEAKDLR